MKSEIRNQKKAIGLGVLLAGAFCFLISSFLFAIGGMPVRSPHLKVATHYDFASHELRVSRWLRGPSPEPRVPAWRRR